VYVRTRKNLDRVRPEPGWARFRGDRDCGKSEIYQEVFFAGDERPITRDKMSNAG
jgi:hypothetical protein